MEKKELETRKKSLDEALRNVEQKIRRMRSETEALSQRLLMTQGAVMELNHLISLFDKKKDPKKSKK